MRLWFLISLFVLLVLPAVAEAQSAIKAKAVGYVEQSFTLAKGSHYDMTPGDGDSIEVLVEAPLVPFPADTLLWETTQEPPPKFTLTDSWDVSSSNVIIPADAELAVGPSHIIAVNNTGIFAYEKVNGNLVLSNSLTDFFSVLSPTNLPVDPVVFYDNFRDRFVALALDADPSLPDSDLLAAVSATGSPTGEWYQVKIPTLLPNFDPDGPGPDPAEPHWSDRPMAGMEQFQVYVAFNMASSGGIIGGTAVWNIWKDGWYDGMSATIQAGIRPFSAGNDYVNEVPLRPVRLHGKIVDDIVDRGIFLAGYQGRRFSGTPSLQIFWLTTVGPSVNKFIIPLGNVDDVAGFGNLPPAPQRNSGLQVSTGQRFVYSGHWRDSVMWLSTMVVPPSGSDASEATAHWIQMDVPDTSSFSLRDQGDVSGNELVPSAHTYFPSLDFSSDGVVAISYAISAPNLELSSALSFIGPRCSSPQVALAPQFLRRGSAVWSGNGQRWGDYSDTVWDEGLCFWSHNAHPVPAAMQTWTSAVGKFCVDPSLVFEDGFESGTTDGWCS